MVAAYHVTIIANGHGKLIIVEGKRLRSKHGSELYETMQTLFLHSIFSVKNTEFSTNSGIYPYKLHNIP